jgi:hypothetical protein
MSNPPQREKHLRWLKLRRQGLTFAEIAEKHGEGVGRTGVHNAVRALVLREASVDARELVATEAARLDYLQSKVWRKATTTHDDAQLPAVDRVLRIMERRASLFGLDGKDLEPEGGEPREVPIEELRELLAGLGYDLVRKNETEDPERDDPDTE